MADLTKLQAFVWNEHEEPLEVQGDPDFDLVRRALMALLEVKEYGKIVKEYPANKVTDHPLEISLHYRAFTDPFRGRQIVGGVDLAEMDRLYQQRKRECALKVFSPAELYALKPVYTDYGSWHVLHVHLPEVDCYFDSDIPSSEVEKAKRFETRTLVDHCSDGRRTWTLQTVWFDGKPVMVVNSSGRDGDEYHERWITDGEAFHGLVRFLNSFRPPERPSDFVEASAKIPAMTEFYNGTIHDFYDTEAQEPKKP